MRIRRLFALFVGIALAGELLATPTNPLIRPPAPGLPRVDDPLPAASMAEPTPERNDERDHRFRDFLRLVEVSAVMGHRAILRHVVDDPNEQGPLAAVSAPSSLGAGQATGPLRRYRTFMLNNFQVFSIHGHQLRVLIDGGIVTLQDVDDGGRTAFVGSVESSEVPGRQQILADKPDPAVAARIRPTGAASAIPSSALPK